ncbi:BrnA antitoxin family protein [Microvirga calopogonii]|uniref:BrnA antitoxin family protein n=1 Tax=Microvirga calopogonii TaxID=2078013 RepID=UPI000E0D6930|nr:BrnA antitoxin family protein [Microvirga calopogonii]
MSRAPGGRRTTDPLKAAEAAFKKVTAKPIEGPPKTTAIPGVKETITLRIDQDVLAYFQEDGPGWQERINAALRKAAGKSGD